MSRLTSELAGTKLYVVENSTIQHDVNGYSGDAINKLAKFENFYDDLVSKQTEITKELEKLRLDGKTRSVKFKQLFANKLTNNSIIILLKSYGIGQNV